MCVCICVLMMACAYIELLLCGAASLEHGTQPPRLPRQAWHNFYPGEIITQLSFLNLPLQFESCDLPATREKQWRFCENKFNPQTQLSTISTDSMNPMSKVRQFLISNNEVPLIKSQIVSKLIQHVSNNSKTVAFVSWFCRWPWNFTY